MRVETVYVADDGKQFHSEDSCREHERECARADAATKFFIEGASLGFAVREAYKGREYVLHVPEEFDLVFADTKLTISHWQCNDKPAYTVSRVLPYSRYDVGGNGGWAGWYGRAVDRADLARYISATFKG